MKTMEKDFKENSNYSDSAEQMIEYYKNLYYEGKEKLEEEEKKYDDLEMQLEAANDQIEMLNKKLIKIKNSIFWKASKPLRVVYFFFKRAADVYVQYGGVKGVLRKMKRKLHQRNVRKEHGTDSFPSPQEAKRQQEFVFPKAVKFSILVPLYNTPEKFLREMIESVTVQTYQNWELCLADGSDGEHADVGEICLDYQKKDPRIKYKKLEKNMGISGNTNVCFEMAEGDYIALFDHDDVLHPSVLFENMKVICDTGADYIYTDEATFEGDSINQMITMHFKPDFAPDNLRANNYICHFSVFDRKLLKETGLFRSAFDGSQDHDLMLRLTSVAKNIQHIPKILYYWRSHAGSVAADINAKSYAIDAAKRAVRDHCRQQGLNLVHIDGTRAFPTIFKLDYALEEEPLVSILIPNKDHIGDLTKCVDSIIKKTTYPHYEIIVIENNSVDNNTFAYYHVLEHKPNIRVVKYEGDFNYSKINNFGARFAKGKYLLLLNNDMKVITPNWLEELLMYAQRKDVGAVGAKLYYADDTIQHAGIVIGLGAHRAAGHTHYKMPKENLGYMGRLQYTQDVTAVTGACLMVKKSLYEELGGLDETFEVALNDVDFCLRLRKKGLLNIFTPFAELYHYESKSRGFETSPEKEKRYQAEVDIFRDKWKAELEKGDPYFNPNFSLDDSDYSLK